MDVPDDMREALRELPLFPLRQAVLFPGALLPLHVFEPRYRALVRDILAGHRCLAIAHVPDPGADMAGRPAIAEVAGVGTVVEHRELPGGRYDVVVLGRARVQLQELSFAPPYRRAIGTMVTSTGRDVPAVEMASLTAAASAFTQQVRSRDPSFAPRLPKDAPPGLLVDACAHQLVLNPRERQSALEERDVRRRVRHVTAVLTEQRAALSRSTGGPVH